MILKTEPRTASGGPPRRSGTSPNGHSGGLWAGAPPAPILPPPKRRRRPLLLTAAVALIVLGALGAYGLATATSQRVAVVAMAGDVAWGQTITPADLTEAKIATDPALHPLLWADRSAAVGRIAANDLHAGSLLTAGDFAAGPIPPAGQALVGVAVKAGSLPASELTARQQVWITHTGQDGQAADAAEPAAPISATVFTVGLPDASGARTVDVLLADTDAAMVAGWSAAGAAAIIAVAGR